LWATNYYLPEIVSGSGNYPLRDINGKALGPRVSHEEWCRIALEGSVRIILESGIVETYNYFGTSDIQENDCTIYYPLLLLGKSKFRLAKGPYGDGYGKYNLVPFRTLAVDPLIIPIGTVFYIPDARGSKIVLKSGDIIIHDGYFIAGDTGGAIKQNHVDVFTSVFKESSFFPWISHNQSTTFRAYIIKDQVIIDEMKRTNRRSN
jgi:3D (Asp-Asp-Asp) domain-containing protein